MQRKRKKNMVKNASSYLGFSLIFNDRPEEADKRKREIKRYVKITVNDQKFTSTCVIHTYIHNWPLQPFSQDY